jgi:5-methylcytosine-specific restriction protein A
MRAPLADKSLDRLKATSGLLCGSTHPPSVKLTYDQWSLRLHLAFRRKQARWCQSILNRRFRPWPCRAALGGFYFPRISSTREGVNRVHRCGLNVHLLYFWRGDNYRRDLDHGVGFHLNQGNPLLHEIHIGESLWAFTRRADGRYAIATELVVSAKTINPKGFRYGPYRVWGDLGRSRYFNLDGQPDISTLIKGLAVEANAAVLGRSFQGRAAVRPLSDANHVRLLSYAERLPLEPRARLLPEERLEALLLAGDEGAVSRLLRDEPAGIAEKRRRYLMTEVATRDRDLVEQLREMYLGACQICRWAPRLNYGTELCEAHHVHWLSRGGTDVLENLVLVCPNHHRAIHRCDAPFDFERNAFVFRTMTEPLVHLQHALLGG